MTAPAAPVIYGHFDGAKARVRWRPVALATDYKVYAGATTNPSGLEDDVADDEVGSDGWFHVTFVVDELPLFINVTALNVGAEESADSNELRIDGWGTNRSYGKAAPPQSPRNTSDPFGAL